MVRATIAARRRRPWRTALVLLSAVLAALGTFTAVRLLNRTVPSTPATASVPVRPASGGGPHVRVVHSWVPPRTTWPAATTGTAVIASAATSAQDTSGRGQVQADALFTTATVAGPAASGGNPPASKFE